MPGFTIYLMAGLLLLLAATAASRILGRQDREVARQLDEARSANPVAYLISKAFVLTAYALAWPAFVAAAVATHYRGRF